MCCSALTEEQSRKTRMKNGGFTSPMPDDVGIFCPSFQVEFKMWDMKGQHYEH